MPKVLHVCPAYFPYRGGIEVLIESAAPVLRRDFGVESEVMAPRHFQERPDDFFLEGTRVYSVDLVNTFGADHAAQAVVTRFARIRRLIESSRPDVVHIHGFSPLALPAASVARTMGVPLVVHIHGELGDTPPEHFLRTISSADLRIAVSEAVRDSMTEHLGEKLPVLVVRNGIKKVEPPRNVAPNPGQLVCVGRLEPQKGFADAIAALPKIMQKHPSVRLTIIGTGQDLFPLQVLANRLGVANSVDFLGRLPHDGVIENVSRSDVVIVPSRSIEGFSLVAAESAALGKPVIATRVGGLTETVEDGETGLLVQPRAPEEIAEAVNTLLSDGELLESFAERSKTHSSASFSIDKFAASLADEYQKLLIEGEQVV